MIAEQEEKRVRSSEKRVRSLNEEPIDLLDDELKAYIVVIQPSRNSQATERME